MFGTNGISQEQAELDKYQENEKRTYTVEEIQRILGVSQPTAYSLVRKNLFRTVRVGRSIRISKKSFDDWLDMRIGNGGASNG